MRDAGWEAGWVDAYERAPRDWADWIVTLRSLPSPLREQYEAITAAANEACRKTLKTDGNNKAHYRGRPDIIAWRGKAPSVTDAVFIEYKGPRDTIKPEQIEWFRAAIKESGSPDRFVIANWPN